MFREDRLYEDEMEFYLRFLNRQVKRGDPLISPMVRDYFMECIEMLKSRCRAFIISQSELDVPGFPVSAQVGAVKLADELGDLLPNS
jgi:hypothetical protein